MALVPLIHCMSHSELQIHSLENYLHDSAPAPMNVVSCGVFSYFNKSDSEDSYV